MPALSEMEFALIIAQNAFFRWTSRCMGAAGCEGLAPLEVLVLHATSHRDREKTLGDICTMHNIEDTHLVTYAIKKLERLDLVTTGKRGKEKTVRITDKGRELCERYGEIREELLVRSVKELGFSEEDISNMARLLRTLSGQYDQAARGAASL